MCHCFVGVFSFFTFHLYLSLGQILQLGDTFQFFTFLLLLTGVMRKEKGGKRGRKKMDEREKESGEVEARSEERSEERRMERSEERTEERSEERTDLLEETEVTEEACEEYERSEDDPVCHSSAKRARVCATFIDSQEVSIVEFVKQHPELYDKEHPHFHDRHRREALWSEISAELKLQSFDVRR